MELTDQIHINASRDAVFAALKDPEVLRVCIPGCEDMTQVKDNEYEARVVLKIGPVKARFSGRVLIDDSDAPAAFSLTGEGNGGVAGFARGGAEVTLVEEPDGGTLLSYRSKAEIGGKIAQLGSRLMLSTSRKLSERFFAAFSEQVGGGVSEASTG